MNTSSLGFPNIFDVTRNKISSYTDNAAVVSRVKLLLMTEPTELYGEPDFGVGLRKFMFQYNNENTITRIKERIVEQLSMWEPYVIASQTEVKSGLHYSDTEGPSSSDPNHLKLTVTIYTKFGDELNISVDDDTLS